MNKSSLIFSKNTLWCPQNLNLGMQTFLQRDGQASAPDKSVICFCKANWLRCLPVALFGIQTTPNASGYSPSHCLLCCLCASCSMEFVHLVTMFSCGTSGIRCSKWIFTLCLPVKITLNQTVSVKGSVHVRLCLGTCASHWTPFESILQTANNEF